MLEHRRKRDYVAGATLPSLMHPVEITYRPKTFNTKVRASAKLCRIGSWVIFIFVFFYWYKNLPKRTLQPACEGKWNASFDPFGSGLTPPQYGTRPLPPFTTGDPPSCRLSRSVASPIPVILVSKGRSGTSSTWQVISKLTGHCFDCEEYTGYNSTESAAFFSRIKPGDNGNWILNYLCSQQNAFIDKGGIVGFKWKPFNRKNVNDVSLDGLDGLRMVAHHINPQIKIVRLRRNHLDVIFSQKKHLAMKEKEGQAYAHCLPHDNKCIETHKQFGSGFNLPTETLLRKLRFLSTLEDKFDKNLDELKVPHIKVSYEKLYHSDDAEEWMRIFRFLDRGPRTSLSKDVVENAMELVGTSNPLHNESMLNYKEVQDILMGTEFETLLH